MRATGRKTRRVVGLNPARSIVAVGFLATLVHVSWALKVEQLNSLHITKNGIECATPGELVSKFNLTREEGEFVSTRVCFSSHLDTSSVNHIHQETRHGIPPGVRCEPKEWCDSGSCTTVCQRGTVEVDDWLKRAHKLQNTLAASIPFCYSSWLGTHNSAITLADGYGNLDPVYQSMFDSVRWLIPSGAASTLRTNDQWLSLTDQLNLGVRLVEIDTHWVEGCLRVAHCGGLHVEALDDIVKALNLIARLMGHHIRWDTETLGCDPSLSSIPPGVQRSLVDALREVREWMSLPENADEFVMIFLDDQPNLKTWGLVQHLIEDILSVFPQEEIFSERNLEELGRWPPIADIKSQGYRVLFISTANFGIDMYPWVMHRGKKVCHWNEPGLKKIQGPPSCNIKTKKGFAHFLNGSIFRTPSCELQYGPLNCDFNWSPKNSPVLDESILPDVIACGMNIPSPDLLTPERSASTIWTWAPGYPLELDDATEGQCAFVASSDGRWRTASCHSSILPTACRRRTFMPDDMDTLWVLASTLRGECPDRTYFDLPRHPRENLQLVTVMVTQGVSGAWIRLDHHLDYTDIKPVPIT